MIGFILFFCVFLFIILRVYNRSRLHPSILLYGLYGLEGACALILVLIYNAASNVHVENYTSGVMYLLFALLIYLYPFYSTSNYSINTISLPRKNVLMPMIYILTGLSIFSIIFFVPIMRTMLTSVNDISYLRQLVALGEHPFLPRSIFNTIAGTSASFYVLQIIFFFIILIDKKRFSFLSILVLLSSLSYPVYVLAYLGRDGVVFWIISFISCFLLFYKFLPSGIIKKIKKYFYIVSIPLVITFLYITFGRFIVSGLESDIIHTLLDYMGQGPINFSEYFYSDVKKMGYGSGIFTLFFEDTDVKDLSLEYERYGIVTWVFKTFIYSINSDFGNILTLFIGLILIILFKILHHNQLSHGNMSFSFIILFNLFFTIYSQGAFYFRHYTNVGNLFIIVMLLMALFFRYVPQRKIQL